MPIATGPSTTRIGSVKMASKLLVAVSVIFSATSPSARCENRFAVAPPGDAASNAWAASACPAPEARNQPAL